MIGMARIRKDDEPKIEMDTNIETETETEIEKNIEIVMNIETEVSKNQTHSKIG